MFDENSAFFDDEAIGRSIPKGFWDPRKKRPISSVFSGHKDGCSVDRQGDRSVNELKGCLYYTHKKDVGVAILAFKVVMENECSVIPDSIEENRYHCNMFDGDGFGIIPEKKGRRLAENCESELFLERLSD